MTANSSRQLALVTGASGGIGEYLAYELAGDGYDLVLVARSREGLERVAGTIAREHGAKASVIALDLALAGACERLFATLSRRELRPDVVVNNAGFGLTGKAAKLSRSEQLEMIDLNVRVLADLSLRSIDAMHGGGGLLNVASVASFMPGPGMAVYFATKAFVLSFTEALARELEGTGAVVSVLCPGPTRTGFSERARPNATGQRKFTHAMSARAVAKIGYRGFKTGKVVVVPGLANKVLTFGPRLAPRRLVRKIAAGFNK